MKKRLAAFLAMSLTSLMILPGCNSGTSTAKSNASTSSASSGVSAFADIVFPDTEPTATIKADDTKYSYDDMTKQYSVSILGTNYGTATLSESKDPICQWLEKKFNLKITYETVASADLATTLSTRIASGDVPDLFQTPDLSTAQSLYDSGTLLDCKTVYPYMPLTCKYVTKNMIKYSTYDDALPFTTLYAIQDGVWGFAIRKDWLKKFNMTEPTTEEALIAYAKACTFDDPDGDGKQDTYFMCPACSGGSVTDGMFNGFSTMFGEAATYVDSTGALSNQYFNGTRQKVLTFLNTLYKDGVLQPDWYTISWEKAKAYTLNDKIGFLFYPAGALLDEYTGAQNNSSNSLNVWEWYKTAPIENGKYGPTGNVGYMWCWSATGFSDAGKMKRVAHMMDTMVLGGDNYFDTIQGGSDEVFKAAGVTLNCTRTWAYNTNGTFYYANSSTKGSPYNDDTFMSEESPWQMFGLNVTLQRSSETTGTTFDKNKAKLENKYCDVINSYDRWSNDGLLSSVADETISPGITDWVNAEELKFVTGKLNISTDWSSFTTEYLKKGGKKIIAAQAKKLGVSTPSYAQ